MITLTVCLLFNATPLSVSIITILQCLLLAAISWISSFDVWMVALLMMVYFGGVMVLLIYISSLAQEDKLVMKLTSGLGLVPLGFMCDCNLPRCLSDSLASPTTSITNLFHFNYMILASLLVTYLLVGLVVVVKVTKFYQGALRQI